MQDAIIILGKDANPKSLKINESDFWFSNKEHKDIKSFQERVRQKSGGFLNQNGIVPFDRILKIKMNEKSEKIVVSYTNEKGKQEEIDIALENESKAHLLGNYLGEKSTLTKSVQKENTTKRALLNLLWPLGTIALTVLVLYMDDMEVDQSSYSKSARRTRFFKNIVQWLHQTIGATGIIILGALLSGIFVYIAWHRFKNPVNDIIYQKQ